MKQKSKNMSFFCTSFQASQIHLNLRWAALTIKELAAVVDTKYQQSTHLLKSADEKSKTFIKKLKCFS